MFIDGNADKLQGWLDRIAVDDPKAAFDLFVSVLEFYVPKMARAEVTGASGQPIFFLLSKEAANA